MTASNQSIFALTYMPMVEPCTKVFCTPTHTVFQFEHMCQHKHIFDLTELCLMTHNCTVCTSSPAPSSQSEHSPLVCTAYSRLFNTNDNELVHLSCVFAAAEIVRIFDGNSSVRRRIYRAVAVPKNAPAQVLLVSASTRPGSSRPWQCSKLPVLRLDQNFRDPFKPLLH